jgi:hypothetical protein
MRIVLDKIWYNRNVSMTQAADCVPGDEELHPEAEEGPRQVPERRAGPGSSAREFAVS